MKPVLAYTAARVVLFVATLGVLYLFGARGVLLLLLALVVSGLVSFVLLSARRDAMSATVTDTLRTRKRLFDEAPGKEDA
ncbi:DUF4229 domain-containing protein [Actinomadura craniellae]|uniref:DUF4229 domain-containing protein n=1 Tax=Actinomadura craniellae TaxID=2231787 RepID=A0A365H852_9ACTN|nr:DUF4229 domain-containing protein [Actinomadura craniellae]RAY15285.1 DUF4229 domain-containing protein [Actinomadura craniellae]